MSWEQTDFSIAARANRADEFRAEADRSRLVGPVIRERRAARRAAVSDAVLRPILWGRQVTSRLLAIIGGVFDSMSVAINPGDLPSPKAAGHD